MLQYFVGHYVSVYTYGELNLEIMFPNSVTFEYPRPEWPFHTGFRVIDAFLFNDQALLQDTILHIILPMLCMTFVSIAGITRQTRASMLEILEQDYIRTARAKGCIEKKVINKHALRNALIPTSNLIIGGTAARLTGALFLETSFNYTGMGYYMVTAIRFGDFIVINGILVFTSLIILSGTLIADVMYTIIDPRITYR
jgi:ABC-type dipeptide/oligopeptide/nickel transport system permease component